MEDITLYDEIIQSVLNHPAISIRVLICTILILIPQIKDGVISVYRFFYPKN